MVKPTKRATPVPAFLKPTVDAIVSAKSDAALSSALANFDAPNHFERPEERSLLNWIEVQERIDAVLKRRIQANPAQIPSRVPSGSAASQVSGALTAALANAGGQNLTAEALVSAVSAAAAAATASSGSSVEPCGTSGTPGEDTERLSDLPPPPLELVMHALNASLRLVRNSSHDSKHLYSSGDLLVSMLADPDTAVVVLSLEALYSLLQRQQRGRSGRALGDYVDAIGRLYALSHGWGGRELGLGIVECCASDAPGGVDEGFLVGGLSARVDFRKDDITQLESQSGGLRPSEAAAGLAGATSSDDFQPERRSVGDPVPISGREGPSETGVAAAVDDTGVSANAARNDDGESTEGPWGSVPSNTERGEASTEVARASARNSTGWYVADVRSLRDDEQWLLSTYAEELGIPRQLRFSLLAAVRRARAFAAGRAARLDMVRIRLLAVSCLALFHPVPSALANVFGFDPELVADIVSLAKADPAHGLGDISLPLRIQAIRCASSVCPDRHRFSQLLTSGGVASHHGILPSLLRAQVAFLLADTSPFPSQRLTAATDDIPLDGVRMNSDPAGESSVAIHMAESVVSLVHNIASCTSGPGATGATALVSSGALGALVPLLGDKNPRHTRVVTQAIRAMECIIESTHTSSGASAFRDQSGLSLLTARIVEEIGISLDSKDVEMRDDQGVAEETPPSTGLAGAVCSRCQPDSSGNAAGSESTRKRKGKCKHTLSKEEEDDESVERDALRARGETRGLYDLLGRRQLTSLEALKHPSPSSSTASRGMLPHTSWTLLRGLMRLLLLTLGSSTGQIGQIREIVAGPLPQALRRIVARPFYFGGNLFATAATTAADIAHAEPTATSALVEARIGKALLRSIRAGLPPSGDAIRCVPNILAALSLAPAAREEIVSVAPLRPYVARLATPFYGRAMHGETPVHIGNSLDELMRHVEPLRSEGSKALIEFLKSAASFVKEATPVDLVAAASGESPAGSPGSQRRALQGDGGTERGARIAQEADAASRIGSASGHKSDPQFGAPESGKDDGGTPAATSGENARNKLLLLDKMRLTVANNAARLAGFAQGSTEYQSAMVKLNGLQYLLDLRIAAAHAVLALNKDGSSSSSTSRNAPTPHNTVTSLANSIRSFCTRHGPAVLRAIFDVIKEDACEVLRIGASLDGKWLEEEESLDGEMPAATGVGMPPISELTGAPHDSKSTESEGSRRCELRKSLNAAVCRLRVDVVILAGLSRPGPGWSAGTWKATSAAEVITLIATVERAARFHIAHVYTGLALQSTVHFGRESNLCGGSVSALADPKLTPVSSSEAGALSRVVGDLAGCSPAEVEKISAAAAKRLVPPGPRELVREEVKGVAWALVTFAVSAQNMYSQLSRSLTYNTRRYMRDQPNSGDNIRAIATAIGRTFALHLMAAEPLWERKVQSCGGGKIPAAWDYIRGVLIELRSCLFDDTRPYEESARLTTDPLLLRSFLAAGGGEALVRACRPSSLAQAAFATKPNATPNGSISTSYVAFYSSLVSLTENRQTIASNPLLFGVGIQAAREVLGSKDPSVGGRDSLKNAAAERRLLDDIDSAKTDLTLASLASDALAANRSHAVHATGVDTWNTLNALLQQMSTCPGLSLETVPAPLPGNPSGELTGVSATDAWTPRDLRRSAQAVAISVVQDALCSSGVTPLSTASQEALASRILPLVQSVSTSSRQLCQLATPPSVDVRRDNGYRGSMWRSWLPPGRGGRGGRGRGGHGETGQARQDMEELMAQYPNQYELDEDAVAAAAEADLAAGSPVRTLAPQEVDPAVLSSIVDMGFAENRARRALQRVHPSGLEQAMDWLLTHPEDEDSSAGRGGNDPEGGDEEERDDDDDEDFGMNDDESRPNESVPVSSSDLEGHGEAMEAEDAEPGEDADDAVAGSSSGAEASSRIVAADAEGSEVMHDSSAGGATSDPVMQDAVGSGEGVMPALLEAGVAPQESASTARGIQTDESRANQTATHECERPMAFHGRGKSSDALSRLGPDGRLVCSDESDAGEVGLLQRAARFERRDLSAAMERAFQVSSAKEKKITLSESEALVGNVLPAGEAIETETAMESTAAPVVHTPAAPSSMRRSEVGRLESIVHASTTTTTARRSERGRLDPVSVDDYAGSKEKMFEALMAVTRRAVQESTAPNMSRDDRCVLGVELLMAMERDGFLGAESRAEYSRLLASGFGFAGDDEKRPSAAAATRSYSLLRSAAVWAHHGDLEVREALAECEVGRSALTLIRNSCCKWESRSSNPSVEDDTVRPIENLSIHESSGGFDGRLLDEPWTSMGEPVGQLSNDEVLMQDLRCVTACLLLLDSFARNRSGDCLRLLSKSLASKQEKKGTTSATGSKSSCPNPVVDDSERTDASPSRMQVDVEEETVTNLEEEEGEMAKARVQRDKEIESLMDVALRDFSEWLQPLRPTLLGPVFQSSYDPEFSFTAGMKVCLRLIVAWKNVEVGDALPAVLQLLSCLTQVPEVAKEFLDAGGVSVLLGIKALSDCSDISSEARLIRSFVRSIIRHLVEDPESLQEAMEIDLRSLFTQQGAAQTPLSLRAVLRLMVPLLERDMETCLRALARVAKLQGNKQHLREYLSAKEMRLRESEGRLDAASQDINGNVKRVVGSLVDLLADSSSPSSYSLATRVAERTPKESRSVAANELGQSVSQEPSSSLGTALFALDVLSELAGIFPVCGAALIHADSPSASIGETALDYVVQRFLPLATCGREWTSKESDLLANLASDSCRQLLAVLCRKEGNSYQHVVDSLTSAAAIELDREPSPRLQAVRVYARTIYSSLQRRCVLSAFLTSGILDSLVQALDKLDLNADGASDVVSSVLLTVETLGKLIGSSPQSSRDDDPRSLFLSGAAAAGLDYRPIALDRRLARSMFANMREVPEALGAYIIGSE
jgi:Domain of Unknown Function (DUF913)/Domain of Unknown Function (DUF908)/UBA/TS-N domain